VVNAPNRLPAHPLVVGLTASAVKKAPAVAASTFALHATDLRPAFQRAVEEASKAATAAANDAAQHAAKDAKPLEQRATVMKEAADATPEGIGAEDYDALGAARGGSPYILIAGYLGGCVNDPGDDASSVMQILYLDEALSAWLLVPLDDVEIFSRVEDRSAAFGLRDVLWLKSDIRVVRGDTADSVQRAYLNGPFVRVEELTMTIAGGTFPRADGLLRRALTPGCCGKTR
jgi:hypothetical protein